MCGPEAHPPHFNSLLYGGLWVSSSQNDSRASSTPFSYSFLLNDPSHRSFPVWSNISTLASRRKNQSHLHCVSHFNGRDFNFTLVLWAQWTDHLGLAAKMVQGFAGVPHWFVIAIGVPLFALFNALAKELV